ncbi:MAG: cytochrome P450 [Pseudonocardiaceae bacterium]|nr:cytochrome P450 [Pseudonocardiaceae bacterium]
MPTHIDLRKEVRTRSQLLIGNGIFRLLAATGDPMARVLGVRPPADPYPLYEKIRARGELSRGRFGFYITPSHGLASAMLRDQRLGTVSTADVNGVDWNVYPGDAEYLVHPVEDSLLAMNPPEHTRLRRLVSPWFTPRALRDRTERIERIVADFLDGVADRGEFELVRDFAIRVPVRVICDLFGIPDSEYQRFSRWGSILAGTLDGIRTVRERRAARDALVGMTGFFDDLIAHRRKQPGDGDVITGLLEARPDGEPLDRRDLVALAGLLLGAGFETTVNLITNGVAALLENPEAKRLLIEQPDRAGDVVEEVLRYDPPVQFTARMTHEPVDYAGVRIPARHLVVLIIGGTNRDPAVFAEPARFDVDRPNNREHLAFSSGIHYCLGAGLARIEGEIALRELFRRFPRLYRAAPPVRRTGRNIRGLQRMPMRTGTARNVLVS